MSPKASRAVEVAARVIIRVRDDNRCQRCGRWLWEGGSYSVHHRLNRGRGGSALLERPSILVHLCGDGVLGCHGWVTRHPKAAGRACDGGSGWLLPRNNPDIDPTQEPILLFDGWHTLDDRGGRTAYIGEVPA